MRLQNPFSAVSSTGIDSQVLTVLARTDGYLTIHEIHRLLPEEGSRPGVRKALSRLVEQGVVLEQATGRFYSYSLNREHLLAEAILRIANAKNELLSKIREGVSQWPIKPVTVKIFGSAARNEMRVDSDIDLFIVMPDETPEGMEDYLAGDLAAKASRWTGNDVRPLVYRVSEVKSAPIFEPIVDEGIDVAGDPAWLRKQLRKTKIVE